MKIMCNKAKCLVCNSTVESKHPTDFVRCNCGNLFVDGGKEMLRRGFVQGESSYAELSEYEGYV